MLTMVRFVSYEHSCRALVLGQAVRIPEQQRETQARKASMSTLYVRLGGAPALNAAVDIFYRKVLSDARIAKFFESVDMDRQAAKQKAFLTMVTGGPSNYTGQDMRAGHAHLVKQGLNDSHFDAVVENLAATLKELGVSDAEIAEVGALANSVRNDVLGR
jgi:hemoglobin